MALDLAPVWIFFYGDMKYPGEGKKSLKQLVDLGALPATHGWSHAYVCPEHGMRLRQSGAQNLCPVDGKDYHGWPIDHVVFMERNSDNTRAARDLGLAFQLTGKPEYAAKVRRIVNAYTALYPKLPIHDNQNRLDTRTGARVMSQTLSESHWLIPLVHAYDLVRDTLPPAERAAFETGVLRSAAAVIARYDARQSNWQSWHNAALLAVGLGVDDRELVKLALDGPSGFKFQMRASIQPDGPWYEGAWGYHFYAFDPLALTREMAGRAGIALPEAAALKRMLDAPLAAVFPDGTLPERIIKHQSQQPRPIAQRSVATFNRPTGARTLMSTEPALASISGSISFPKMTATVFDFESDLTVARYDIPLSL